MLSVSPVVEADSSWRTILMPNPLETLRSRIDQRHVLVGVIGLGYVGLPLLQAFIKAGFRTIEIGRAHV